LKLNHSWVSATPDDASLVTKSTANGELVANGGLVQDD